MDNYGTYKTSAIKRWLAPNPRVHVHFSRCYRGTVELEDAIRGYLALDNRDQRPFVWTKTADQILERIKRFCRRTSNSGH